MIAGEPRTEAGRHEAFDHRPGRERKTANEASHIDMSDAFQELSNSQLRPAELRPVTAPAVDD